MIYNMDMDMTGEVGQQPLNVEEANVPRIYNMDMDMAGEAGQQQQLEAPMHYAASENN